MGTPKKTYHPVHPVHPVHLVNPVLPATISPPYVLSSHVSPSPASFIPAGFPFHGSPVSEYRSPLVYGTYTTMHTSVHELFSSERTVLRATQSLQSTNPVVAHELPGVVYGPEAPPAKHSARLTHDEKPVARELFADIRKDDRDVALETEDGGSLDEKTKVHESSTQTCLSETIDEQEIMPKPEQRADASDQLLREVTDSQDKEEPSPSPVGPKSSKVTAAIPVIPRLSMPRVVTGSYYVTGVGEDSLASPRGFGRRLSIGEDLSREKVAADPPVTMRSPGPQHTSRSGPLGDVTHTLGCLAKTMITIVDDNHNQRKILQNIRDIVTTVRPAQDITSLLTPRSSGLQSSRTCRSGTGDRLASPRFTARGRIPTTSGLQSPRHVVEPRVPIAKKPLQKTFMLTYKHATRKDASTAESSIAVLNAGRSIDTQTDNFGLPIDLLYKIQILISFIDKSQDIPDGIKKFLLPFFRGIESSHFLYDEERNRTIEFIKQFAKNSKELFASLNIGGIILPIYLQSIGKFGEDKRNDSISSPRSLLTPYNLALATIGWISPQEQEQEQRLTVTGSHYNSILSFIKSHHSRDIIDYLHRISFSSFRLHHTSAFSFIKIWYLQRTIIENITNYFINYEKDTTLAIKGAGEHISNVQNITNNSFSWSVASLEILSSVIDSIIFLLNIIKYISISVATISSILLYLNCDIIHNKFIFELGHWVISNIKVLSIALDNISESYMVLFPLVIGNISLLSCCFLGFFTTQFVKNGLSVAKESIVKKPIYNLRTRVSEATEINVETEVLKLNPTQFVS